MGNIPALLDENGRPSYKVKDSAELWDAVNYFSLPALRLNVERGRLETLLRHFGQGGMLEEAEFIICEREESLKLRSEQPKLFEMNNSNYLPKRSVLIELPKPRAWIPRPEGPAPSEEYPDLNNR